MTELEMADFLCDEVVQTIHDAAGVQQDIDDLPQSRVNVLVVAMMENLAPNGRNGSRRRPRTQR